MTQALLNRDQIEQRIPHAGRMCLIDRLEAWDNATIHCSTLSHLDRDHPLRSESGLLAPCAIEYAAQAMALHGGLLQEAEHARGTRQGHGDGTEEGPSAGFIASVRNVRFFAPRLDQVAGALQVRAERLSGDRQQVLYAFDLHSEAGAPIATGRAVVVLNTPMPHSAS